MCPSPYWFACKRMFSFVLGHGFVSEPLPGHMTWTKTISLGGQFMVFQLLLLWIWSDDRSIYDYSYLGNKNYVGKLQKFLRPARIASVGKPGSKRKCLSSLGTCKIFKRVQLPIISLKNWITMCRQRPVMLDRSFTHKIGGVRSVDLKISTALFTPGIICCVTRLRTLSWALAAKSFVLGRGGITHILFWISGSVDSITWIIVEQ